MRLFFLIIALFSPVGFSTDFEAVYAKLKSESHVEMFVYLGMEWSGGLIAKVGWKRISQLPPRAISVVLRGAPQSILAFKDGEGFSFDRDETISLIERSLIREAAVNAMVAQIAAKNDAELASGPIELNPHPENRTWWFGSENRRRKRYVANLGVFDALQAYARIFEIVLSEKSRVSIAAGKRGLDSFVAWKMEEHQKLLDAYERLYPFTTPGREIFKRAYASLAAYAGKAAADGIGETAIAVKPIEKKGPDVRPYLVRSAGEIETLWLPADHSFFSTGAKNRYVVVGAIDPLLGPGSWLCAPDIAEKVIFFYSDAEPESRVTLPGAIQIWGSAVEVSTKPGIRLENCVGALVSGLRRVR